MPRTAKDRSNHDKVVPLSLPEVQLSIANSLQRDTVDEEAVIRAVQGYELLLQGSLRNSYSETTRELKGHGGYYHNLMRGVAQVFGVKKVNGGQDQVVRAASSSDDDALGAEDISDHSTEPPLKKTKTNDLNIAQNDEEEANKTEHARTTTETASTPPLPGISSTSRHSGDETVQPPHVNASDAEAKPDANNSNQNRQEVTVKEISRPQNLTVTEKPPTSSSPPPAPFNRYKRQDKRRTEVTAEEEETGRQQSIAENKNLEALETEKQSAEENTPIHRQCLLKRLQKFKKKGLWRKALQQVMLQEKCGALNAKEENISYRIGS